MVKLASEIQIGDIIKSPFSPYIGEVILIVTTSVAKKITFQVRFVKHPYKEYLGTTWSYTFLKTTKIRTYQHTPPETPLHQNLQVTDVSGRGRDK